MILTAVHWTVCAVLARMPASKIEAVWVIYSAIVWSLALFLWVTLYLSIAFVRRYEQVGRERLRLEAAGREAELEALRAQLNPHSCSTP